MLKTCHSVTNRQNLQIKFLSSLQEHFSGKNFGGSEELLYLCAIKNKYDENGKQF